MLGLSQVGYIDKILARFSMQNSKKLLLPFRHRVPLSDDQRPKPLEKEKMMRQISYASTVSCMPCYVINQISVIQLAWSTNINQIQDQNIRRL